MVANAVDNIIKRYGAIGVLVNNAGVWLAGDLTTNSYEEIKNCINVNTLGSIFMTKAVLPYMYKEKKGLIINVCSQSSFDSDDFSPVYTASKWAMRGFNRSMQNSITKKGVKLTGFYPGFMQTNLFKKAGNDYDTSTGLEVSKVAKAVRYILSCDDDVMIPEFGIRDIKNY
jgi:NADP-dependent 3-hydroxy acid dehydrogenase YdfG